MITQSLKPAVLSFRVIFKTKKNAPKLGAFFINNMVRLEGLEPSRLASPTPQAGVSTIPPQPRGVHFTDCAAQMLLKIRLC